VWRGPNWLEVGAVIGTGLLHLLFLKVIGYHLLFIIAAIAGWAWYVASSARLNPGRLRDWGFRRAGFEPTFLVTASVTALAIGVMALMGWHRGHLRFHWHMLPLLLLYPIWGVIQQFLIQALVVANLMRDERGPRSPWLPLLVSACLFASAHVPNLELMAATFLLGAAFTPIYLRWQNLWPLGLCHGWAGLFFYFWVQGSDPVNVLLKGFR
jgi:hypothetical protein